MAIIDDVLGSELSDELLEGLVGGALDKKEQARVLDALTKAKQAGRTLEEAMASYMRGNTKRGDLEDYRAFMTAVWEQIDA